MGSWAEDHFHTEPPLVRGLFGFRQVRFHGGHALEKSLTAFKEWMETRHIGTRSVRRALEKVDRTKFHELSTQSMHMHKQSGSCETQDGIQPTQRQLVSAAKRKTLAPPFSCDNSENRGATQTVGIGMRTIGVKRCTTSLFLKILIANNQPTGTCLWYRIEYFVMNPSTALLNRIPGAHIGRI